MLKGAKSLEPKSSQYFIRLCIGDIWKETENLITDRTDRAKESIKEIRRLSKKVGEALDNLELQMNLKDPPCCCTTCKYICTTMCQTLKCPHPNVKTGICESCLSNQNIIFSEKIVEG